MISSAAFRFEVPKRAWRNRCRNFKSAALNLVTRNLAERLPEHVRPIGDRGRLAGADIEIVLGRGRGAVPPTAAERLEQRRGVGEASRTRLRHLNDRLLIGLLRG